MNNDLEQLSEERLKELSNINGDINTRFCDADIEALARIALAAKQAKPEYHIVRLELNDAWGSETVLNAYESQHDASKCKDDHGGVIIPCYTTPQPAHTEQDGWIKCSERIPEEGGRYWCYVEEQNSLGKSHYQWNCSWNGDCWSDDALSGRVTHWMPLPAAPKPESE